jgi:hypothetical protein
MHWEQEKNKKILPMKEKFGPLNSACKVVWVNMPIFFPLISKTICHHFWHGLIPGAQIMVHTMQLGNSNPPKEIESNNAK